MGKRKLTYQVRVKEKITIELTGEVYLQYIDEEEIAAAKKGDVMMYAYSDALHSSRFGEYEGLGLVGYFKLDVFDGRDWKPVVATDLFPHREQHFGKKERPVDTYEICAEIVRGLKGMVLVRTYREHYEPLEE